MPKAKPKIERTCLVCDATFMGTPAATRCDPCKDAGHRVPAQRQKERRRKPVETRSPEELLAAAQALREKQAQREAQREAERLELEAEKQRERIEREAQRLEREAEKERKRLASLITKTCAACGSEFKTHKAKAVRCDPCIEAGNLATYKSCIECSKLFATHDGMIRCAPCADLLSVDQYELTPEQEEQLRAERRKAKWKEQLQAHRAWLDRRENAKPKGYKKMKKATMKTPLGVLWLEICHADGAAASVFHRFEVNLTEEQKVHLLTTFLRLRVKGYHPSAIAQLCPVAILERITDEALEELPKVDLDDPEEDLTFDPLEGLSDELKDEIVAFQEQQSRQAELMQLGLTM